MSDGEGLRRFLGGLLMAAGGVIALLSGLCSGLYEVALFPGWRHIASGPSLLVMSIPLLAGFFPILIGIGLFLLGRGMLRPPPAAP
jgi:hypothetical protein